ncbi:MAG TPA: hypothetical protein VG326_14475 [Tepidisphaeraceae bacterium]|nr:hypothetical protein [Tepidisphaeraceae bacterium]
MGHRTLDRKSATVIQIVWMAVMAMVFAFAPLRAQTADKKHSIFDDDNPPAAPGPATPGPATGHPVDAPPVAAPAPGAVAGLIATLHGGDTTEAKPREYHLTPNLGINFVFPVTPGAYIPMAFSFRGLINIPAGGAQGTFLIKCTGESDLMFDGQVVSAVHPGDSAASFEHPQNLPAGVHTINATAFHLRGTGARQSIQLWFKPSGAIERRVPKDWCWHFRADEPAELTAIAPANPDGSSIDTTGGNDPRHGWVKAGTVRPDDPSARPTDLLAGVVVESYASSFLQRLKQFRTLDRPTMDLTVTANPNAVQQPNGAASIVNISFKWRGYLKIDSPMQCRFGMPVSPAQVRVIIDNHVVTAVGFAREADVITPVHLDAGLHSFEAELSRMRLAGGSKYGLFLQWEPNGQAAEPVPANVVFHYRSQEPFENASVASAPPGGATPPAPIVVKARKLAIPDPQSQAASAALLQQKYAADWAAAASAEQADRFLKAADENRGDAVAIFVLLEKAYEQAVAASSVDLTFKAIDQLSANYSIDGLRMKLAVLKLPESTRIATAADLNPVVTLFEQAISEDNYSVATDAAAMSLAQAKTLNAPPEIEAASRRVQIAAAASAEYAVIKPMLSRLTDNPNDAEASLAAGKFYCFAARNWARGAPLLAHFGDPTLSWLGNHEMTAQSAPTQLALANGWWDAATAQNETVAAAMRDHAAVLYRTALPNLAGLSRRLAERRASKSSSTASAPVSVGGGAGKL